MLPPIPISLYIHIPWCIRKCPYCDFNSHKSPETLPEEGYVQALIQDFEIDLATFPMQQIDTVFIGGGTPSLFSAKSYAILFERLRTLIPFKSDIEITLEANPGTVEYQRFADYRAIGINRLSLGVQSFNPLHLKKLGRIHDEKQAHLAITAARKAGFNNINLDIMHSLPKQTTTEGLTDLKTALSYNPEHLSWYELTIEPNTLFYKYPPALPQDAEREYLEHNGLSLLQNSGYERYEISAFAKNNGMAKHNLNYWLFGDYVGIGAGAHGKYTTKEGVFRTQKHRQPIVYLAAEKPFLAKKEKIKAHDLVFEFMLNTTRLQQPIFPSLFEKRTLLPFSYLEPLIIKAENKGLLKREEESWQITTLGRRFTNDLQAIFLT